MIGISYGAYAAIVYSELFPTSSIIIIDPARQGWNCNINNILTNSKSKIFYHRSIHPHDVLEYEQIRNSLEKPSCYYLIKCSLSQVHSCNIPNEEQIIEYIKFSELLENPKCNLLMTKTKCQELDLEFLPWI